MEYFRSKVLELVLLVISLTCSKLLQWNLKTQMPYTLVFIPGRYPPLSLEIDEGVWIHYDYPYRNLPLLQCHVAPPFAVINAARKCKRDHIDQITLDHYLPHTSQSVDLKRQLTLLCDIWALFQAAEEAAKAWGGSTKRKREQNDDDAEELSQTSRRTTRSQGRSAHGGGTPQNLIYPETQPG
jgi:hypothetical protein